MIRALMAALMVAASLLGIPVAHADTAPLGPPGSWTLTFDDEFNGTSLDTSKWTPCWGSAYGCGMVNSASTSPSNVSVANGAVALNLAWWQGAAITTNPAWGGGYQFTTGVIEARVFFPGNGWACYNWPAFWTDGQDPWPSHGENDIAEVAFGNSPQQTQVAYHSPTTAQAGTPADTIPGQWCNGWHTFTLNRQIGRSDVYYDGQLVKSYLTNDGNAPQYIALNIGNGGWGAWWQPVYVDYVRAWN